MGRQRDAILRRRKRVGLFTVCGEAHNICAGLGRNLSEAIALPSSDILTSTEVGQWTRQNGFCDLPPNAS
jgi:transketolase C-terminal domain/subunit